MNGFLLSELFSRSFEAPEEETFGWSVSNTVEECEAKLAEQTSKKASSPLFAPQNLIVAPFNYRPFDKRYGCFDISGSAGKVLSLFQPMQPAIVQSHCADCSKTHFGVTTRLVGRQFLSEKPTGKTTLFPLYQASQARNRTLNLNPGAVDQFSKALKLGFSASRSPSASNVCLAEAPGVRSEFKVSFSEVDVFDYALACLWKQEADQPIISLPADDQQFWKLVKTGASLRNLQSRP